MLIISVPGPHYSESTGAEKNIYIYMYVYMCIYIEINQQFIDNLDETLSDTQRVTPREETPGIPKQFTSAHLRDVLLCFQHL